MLFRRTQAVFTAVCARENYFNVGAGIVADSNPEAEYEETLAKAAGFLAALNFEIGSAAAPNGSVGSPADQHGRKP
jgi:chorismate binding enzyme